LDCQGLGGAHGECEPIMGVWGQSLLSEGEAPEADCIFVLGRTLLRLSCDILRCCSLFATLQHVHVLIEKNKESNQSTVQCVK